MATAAALSRDQLRHLLRRLCFASTPATEKALSGLSADTAFDALWSASLAATPRALPAFLSESWTNSALRLAGQTSAAFDVARAAQLARHLDGLRRLREDWIAQLVDSEAGLRESLVLFLLGFVGSSSTAVEIPHALAQRNAALWRVCMTGYPELLETLVVDPAAMIQIGMDGHGSDRVSDRPALRVLEGWTVGRGAFSDDDVAELSRALTGWVLAAESPTDALAFAPNASRAEQRTGLVPRFDRSSFESRSKTLLGTTADFDARSAVRFLAAREATARRLGRALLAYLGVADADGALEQRLVSVYSSTGGSFRELLRAIVTADEFWSDGSRWTLIKSPAHLAVGACRQLGLHDVPLSAVDAWLAACGQPLFDTPNNGEDSWPEQDAWITPPDRLALRYQLPAALAGEALALGIGRAPASQPTTTSALRTVRMTSSELVDRLNPAPGLDLAGHAARRGGDSAATIRRVMSTPQYQLA